MKNKKLDTFQKHANLAHTASAAHDESDGAHGRSSASATVCPPAAGRRAAKEVLHGCACVDPWRI